MADDIDIDAIEDAGLLDGLEGEARAERAELIEWLLAEGFTLRHIQLRVRTDADACRPRRR